MAQDALDPGPLENYPHWPRKPDGTPDVERMPTGTHFQRSAKTIQRVRVDVTPRFPVDHPRAGEPIDPPPPIGAAILAYLAREAE